MMDYTPFWKTLRNSGESTYTLITKHRMSSSTISKLKHNKPLTTTTLNDICRLLNCSIHDVVRYIPSDKDQFL